ncbi:MAG: hypothetical protein V2A67_09690 [Bacteroidota bacterium]
MKPVICRFSFIILLITNLVWYNGFTQYYTVGNDPSSVHWKKSEIGQFKLIYPDYFSTEASLMGQILRDAPSFVTASMPTQMRKIPVIVHPESVFSNGYSILAPRRIEVFPKSPIAGETGDFHSQLIIHEFRHLAQMEKLNVGFTRGAAILLGEQAQAIVLGLQVPKWFLEGDAVLTETLLSDAGRGRLAGFSQTMRTKLLAGQEPTWDQVQLGSYRDVLPNEYVFGYYMTSRGRMLSYPLLWADNLTRIARNPFRISSFSSFIKKKTGYRSPGLYKSTMEWLRNYWQSSAFSEYYIDGLRIYSQDTSDYYSYVKPISNCNRVLVCLKKSLGNLPSFVRIDSTGKETLIAYPGTIEDAGFSIHGSLIVWAEHIPDSRWENRSWSDVFIMDQSSGKKTRLTRHQRLFSPAFNPDGSKITCISEDTKGRSGIMILEPTDGSKSYQYWVDEGEHVNYLSWGINNDELFIISTRSEGRCLFLLNTASNVREVLIEAGHEDISHPALIGDYVYFTGPIRSAQGLYRIHLVTHQLEKAMEHRYGIDFLTARDNELFFSVHTPQGYRPAAITADKLHPVTINRIQHFGDPVTGSIIRAGGEVPMSAAAKPGELPNMPYRKVLHLLSFHSWAPLFLDPDSYKISPGVMVMSQNDLSTMTMHGGYQYHKPQQSHNLIAGFQYTGWLPVIEANYLREYRAPDTLTSEEYTSRRLEFYNQSARVRISIPFNYSAGIWTRRFTPALFLVNRFGRNTGDEHYPRWMAGLSVDLKIIRKLSFRDLFPRTGFALSGELMKPLSANIGGNNLNARLLIYLPGGFANSSIRILNSVHHNSFGLFLEDPYPDLPRGSSVLSGDKYYSLKVDYSMPLAYPEWSLAWLLYVKRLKANLFFDGSYGWDNKEWQFTTGLDLTADYHLIRAGVQLESGIRIIWFPQLNEFGTEFLYGFSIN